MKIKLGYANAINKRFCSTANGPYIPLLQSPQDVAVTLLKGVIVQNRSDQSS